VAVSFLEQLKSQANSLQDRQASVQQDVQANALQTEQACAQVWQYLGELAKQLNVLQPAGAAFSLDDKTPWPAMKLEKFGVDARKKNLRDKEVFNYIAMGWTITPKMGVPVGGAVTVTYLPDVDRIQKRINLAHVAHERKEQRHPERHNLQSVRFDYTTQARGFVTVSANHDAAQLSFRLANAQGFNVQEKVLDCRAVNHAVLDELAKLIVAQPSSFL
jgi:hypothetical protein